VFTADACDNAAMTAYGDVFPCCFFVKVKRTNDLTSRGLLEPRYSFGDTTHLTPIDPAPHAQGRHQQASKDMFKKFVHFPFVLSA